MWEAALGVARNRLADALLARSIEGSVEYYYRDGELVGEKRHIDNRLGLAVLRRLDRLMETGSPLPFHAQSNPVRTEPRQSGQRRRAPPSSALDWDQMIGALRTREPGAMAVALAALNAHEVPETHETHDPPDSLIDSLAAADENDELEDGNDRVWRSHEDWWTSFPPPAGFNGVEHGAWGSYGYKCVCTGEEVALLNAVHALDNAGERAAQEAERTAYFADIAAELAELEGANSNPDPDPI